jgi:hypothetical protein
MRGSDKSSTIRMQTLVRPMAGLMGAACAMSLSMVTAAHAGSAPPKGLYGKSITVSWSETRSQRFVGEQTFRPVGVNLQRSVYISSAGRVFARTSSNAATRSGRNALSGAAERVGTSGTNFSGGASNVQFQGNSMVMRGEFTGSARQVMVNFDNSFESCTAQALTAKQVGTKVAVWRGIASGRMLEVESVSSGPASCSIKSGNVFAD